MKYQVAGTLDYYRAFPHFQSFSLGHYPIHCVAQQSKAFYAMVNLGGVTLPVPDSEALDFYCQNHLASLVIKRFSPYETLPLWAIGVMDNYANVVSLQTQRLLFYMFMICTREARHNGHSSTSEWGKSFANKFGAKIAQWFFGLKGGGSQETAGKFRDMPQSSMLTAQYAKALSVLFHTGAFGGSYGGKPWGHIADTIESFVTGKTSAEVFIDTAYTLAHNNGPMFNKGMLYQNYTNHFMKILDVQRSGQIPEYIIEYMSVKQVSEATLSSLKGFREESPGVLGNYVDWMQVEALGSLHKYPVEVAQQKNKYGEGSSPPKAIPPNWNVAIPPEADPLFKAKVLGKFKILPNLSVPYIERVA